MKKVLMVNHEKCTMCRRCELVCSLKHAGEFNPVKARVNVAAFPDDFFYMPVTCQQCDEPVCAEVCPAGALSHNEVTGAVELDSNRCIGCRMCVAACPFGAMSYSAADETVFKCELCDGEPECALFCPWGAIEYAGADAINLEKRRGVALKLRDALKEVRV
ncbi:MAG: 4Fe-4S dicluster domain-containing protein [Firmicutes bacterium]|nr:4Fe-4S dicluster domain-containing protein [Bacillota bacterium]